MRAVLRVSSSFCFFWLSESLGVLRFSLLSKPCDVDVSYKNEESSSSKSDDELTFTSSGAALVLPR